MKSVFLILYFHLLLEAAPFPGSSQALLNFSNYFAHESGFSMDAEVSEWRSLLAENSSAIRTYESKNAKQKIRLSIRIEQIENAKLAYLKSSENYLQYWQSQYSKFGFKIVNSKANAIADTSSTLSIEKFAFAYLESVDEQSNFKSAQWAVFVKDKIIHFHCYAKNQDFLDSKSKCMKVLNSFRM